MKIIKTVTTADLQDIFEGNIPDQHPGWYIESRIRDDRVFLAQKNTENMGFLIYDIWWGNCPFIELIKVRPDHQRQGTGLSLLDAAIKEIRTLNFKKLISSSEIMNDMGLSFHERAGFKKTGTLMLPHSKEQFFSMEI